MLISFLRYLHRFDHELEKINEQNSIKGRQGRAHASREDTLNTVIERERELYNTCGIGEKKIWRILHGSVKIFMNFTFEW